MTAKRPRTGCNCARRGKHRYRDKQAAVAAMHLVQSRGDPRARTPNRAYECPACHGWFLTCDPERSEGRPT